ncbi:hypothetical protein Rhe02_30190 [Rhizocola hellebori]|uniref:Uncharacterized protein n=1 Tax=Rhizocola hellebori TaxID=1392758 RepID=A0A8J3Q7S3_9ACTN|nr:hypothetical protein [Rhizocola hellebori]GIH04952.1 hypothetical protein Rhe02_30190 [Rhizocola hellebori]
MLLRVRNTLIAVVTLTGLTAGITVAASALATGPTAAPAWVASATPSGEPEPTPSSDPIPSAEPTPTPSAEPTEPVPTPTETSCPAPPDTAIRLVGLAKAAPCASEYDISDGFKATVTPEDKKLTIRIFSRNNTCQVDKITWVFLVGQKPDAATINDNPDPAQGKGHSWVFDHTKVKDGVAVKIRLRVSYTCNGTKGEFTWTFLWNTTGDVNVFSPQGA